jgi:hypothetical protein
MVAPMCRALMLSLLSWVSRLVEEVAVDVVYAVDTAQIPTKEVGLVFVRRGTHWPADDVVVRTAPWLFSTDPQYGLQFSSPPVDEPVVELATAVPGERRSVRRG